MFINVSSIKRHRVLHILHCGLYIYIYLTVYQRKINYSMYILIYLFMIIHIMKLKNELHIKRFKQKLSGTPSFGSKRRLNAITTTSQIVLNY